MNMALSSRRQPARQPRSEEIVLLQGLAHGSRVIIEDPLGRCLKRGWRRAIDTPLDALDPARTGGWAPRHYELTDLGRKSLAQAAGTEAQGLFGREAQGTSATINRTMERHGG
jgi:hypothetical protein